MMHRGDTVCPDHHGSHCGEVRGNGLDTPPITQLDERPFIKGGPAHEPELGGYVSSLKIAAERDRTADLAVSSPGDAAEFVRKQMLAGMTVNEIRRRNHHKVDLSSLKLLIDAVTKRKHFEANSRRLPIDALHHSVHQYDARIIGNDQPKAAF